MKAVFVSYLRPVIPSYQTDGIVFKITGAIWVL